MVSAFFFAEFWVLEYQEHQLEGNDNHGNGDWIGRGIRCGHIIGSGGLDERS